MQRVNHSDSSDLLDEPVINSIAETDEIAQVALQLGAGKELPESLGRYGRPHVRNEDSR